jgi:hypothetical protein
MSSVIWRIDYAKFLIQCHPEHWASYYHRLNEESHELKCAGEWLKSHKVNRLWYNPSQDMETWAIDIWGEWASIVRQLPAEWSVWLKRLDVRSTIWDATEETILDVGQHMQRNVTSHNINVFATKKASKRMGRDRGGVGFAIGSHKSDLRITTYKRSGEPVAQEFQCSGAMLSRLVVDSAKRYARSQRSTDIWADIAFRVQMEGSRRLERVMESAGLGTYWPIIGTEDAPTLPPIQAAFIPEVKEVISEDGELLGPSSV